MGKVIPFPTALESEYPTYSEEELAKVFAPDDDRFADWDFGPDGGLMVHDAPPPQPTRLERLVRFFSRWHPAGGSRAPTERQ